MKRVITLCLIVVFAALTTGCATPFLLNGKTTRVSKAWLAFSNKNVEPLEYLIFVPPTGGFKTGVWVYVEAPTLVRPPGENSRAGLDMLQDQIDDLRLKTEDLVSKERSDSLSAPADSLVAEARNIQKRLRAERAKRLARANGGPLENETTEAVECPVGLQRFYYFILRSGRFDTARRSFDFFVKPAEPGKARVINLAGHKL